MSNNKDNMTHELLDDILHEKGIEVTYNSIKHRIDINDTNKVLNGSEQPLKSLIAYLSENLRDSYKYVSSNHIDGYLTLISEKYMKNSILEKIKNCKISKSNDYIKDICENVLNIDKADKLSYTLVYKFFLQAVSMLMNKKENAYGAEGVLVLQGAQGIGKSLFCQRMSLSTEYFDTIQIDSRIDRADMLDKINGVFIGELAEVEQSLKPNNVAILKDIITASIDIYRPKWGKLVNYVRRSSLIATCNTSYFLQDVTGNRRFWVIPCKKPFNIERLLHDNDIFLKAYKQAFNILQSKGTQSFRLTKSETIQLENRNDQYIYTTSVLTPDILDKLYACDYFTISDLKNQYKALRREDASKIGKELAALGATKKRKKQGMVYSLKGE